MSLPELLEVEVTAQDITDGKPEESAECPIALAVGRSLDRDDFTVFVDSRGLVFLDGEEWVCYDTDQVQKAKVFVRDFDCGRGVEGFKFSLERPEGWNDE